MTVDVEVAEVGSEHPKRLLLILLVTDVRLNVFQFDRFRINAAHDALNLLHTGQHFDTMACAQDLPGDSAGSHAPDRFAGARPPAALPIANAELGLV